MLIKFIYILKFHMKQISIFSKQARKYRFKHFDDSKDFIEYSNDIWMICIEILKNTVQIKNVKY